MIVDLTHKIHNLEYDIKLSTLRLINLFGYLSYEEIVDFFPVYNEDTIYKCCKELIRIHHLKRVFIKRKTFYTTNEIQKNNIGMKLRNKYLEIAGFIRYLLNVKDEEGYLINNVECIGEGTYPFDIFIVCNNTVFDFTYCTKEKIPLYEQVLSRLDSAFDKKEEKRKKKLPQDSPYLNSEEEKTRIVIVDSAENFNLIHFRKVKYVVCRNGNEYLIKEGD